ncbi:hypothetical protein AGABI1DRAFT_45720 [Agaricus bisporus var. burnettii JB137-S8]|uniref:Uncharacterized protein n=1 Tax=Agaricus bisporus var. burnettii (strain JB137-S8 / ATCC MYA-4627 / FGSC 10392) TaxID=597362 RepID=K5WYJ2_AGABU|nr:uncharacterized protein AGABI1DRAFT_45720 [Agaricus bisporus var. burnettii JB137-S8]EKM75903.1 hypothetical protein AGABI1DRAFT_45720 [Agaricus bisporus var. burnettii JB137-S8]
MCYRDVACVKHSCGHESPVSDKRVDCGSNKCRYSSRHNPACPNCTSTCTQWLRPARTTVTSRSDAPCSSCR